MQATPSWQHPQGLVTGVVCTRTPLCHESKGLPFPCMPGPRGSRLACAGRCSVTATSCARATSLHATLLLSRHPPQLPPPADWSLSCLRPQHIDMGCAAFVIDACTKTHSALLLPSPPPAPRSHSPHLFPHSPTPAPAEFLPAPPPSTQVVLSNTYEQFMTAWFTHPNVKGILNWGFWWVGWWLVGWLVGQHGVAVCRSMHACRQAGIRATAGRLGSRGPLMELQNGHVPLTWRHIKPLSRCTALPRCC